MEGGGHGRVENKIILAFIFWCQVLRISQYGILLLSLSVSEYSNCDYYNKYNYNIIILYIQSWEQT